jgi:hypothetical protein
VTFGPLRSLVLSLNQAAHGVTVTVTRVAPASTTPIETTGIWLTAPLAEQRPFGTDFQRNQPRKVMVLAKSDFDSVPRGSIVVAPETQGGANKNWRVDGYYEPNEADHWRVILILAP